MLNSTLDDFIATAIKSKTDEDYDACMNAANGCELYFTVKPITAEDANPGDVEIPLVPVGNELFAVVFYTSSEHPDLQGAQYGGVDWQKGLAMVLEMPKANGIILQSAGNDWLGISESTIKALVA